MSWPKVNPYSIDQPANALFYGRQSQVEKLAADLTAPIAGSYALIGGRRFGKTSLLHAVERRLWAKCSGPTDDTYYVIPLYLNLLGDEIVDLGGFFSLVMDVLTAQVQEHCPDLIPPDWSASLPIDSGRPAHRIFADRVSGLCQNIARRGRPLRVLLLLDETEEILDRPWRHNLFNRLRWLIYENERTHNYLKVVLAGSSSFYSDVVQTSSPLWGILKFEYLKAFPEDETWRLIQEPCNEQIPETIAREILKYSGGHPYLVQYMMYHLWQERPSGNSCQWVAELAERFMHERPSQLNSWRESVGEGGCQAYAILLSHANWMDENAIRRAIGTSTPELRSALTALCYHGLAIHNDAWRYRAVGELFRKWFMANARPSEYTDNRKHPEITLQEVKDVTERYVDFDLHIAPDGRATANSPEGQATTEISTQIPNSIRLALNLVEKRQTDSDLLKQLGQELYDWIFPAAIHTHFQQTEAVARTERAKVRLRLRIEADTIASLPLEFIYRLSGGYFMAVNPSTVLSRYLNLPCPPERVRRREGPLHMLAIVADPIDQTRLNPDEWEALIRESLAGPFASGQMTLQMVKRATRKEIRNALLEQKPDVIQFVGHGIYHKGKGHLALVDENTGGTWLVDDERFANLYLGFDDHLGLINLATCESAKTDDPQGFLGIAPQLVQRGTPAVIAMQYKVYIRTAKVFLEDFYLSVAARKPIDWATQWARNAVSLEFGLDNREFATPVLYMRAEDGQVF
jgi:AAA+ ATPase superfamily predicted ATPase